MDIIAISDVHGDIENLLGFLDKIRSLKFDVIIYAGDFTDVNVPKGFTLNDVTKIIIKELKTLNKPVLAVPGNMDLKDTIEILEKENVSIHNKGKVIGNFGFYGFGGAKTPFNCPFEPSEEELKIGLKKSYNEIISQNHKIQITHNPPLGSKLDMISSGAHVGSKVVKEFIETNKPIVAISAHIHEAKGIDKLGETFLLNPGRFPEGHFGLITIEDDGKVNGKVLNLVE